MVVNGRLFMERGADQELSNSSAKAGTFLLVSSTWLTLFLLLSIFAPSFWNYFVFYNYQLLTHENRYSFTMRSMDAGFGVYNIYIHQLGQIYTYTYIILLLFSYQMYIQKLYVNDIYWLKFKDLEVFIWLNINLLKYTLFSWHGVKQ